VTYALLIVLAAGGLSSGILAALWQGAKGALIKERSDHDSTKADLAATNTGLKISEAARGDERTRLNTLIVELKKEIATLEANLPADPGAVRDRLNQLLGGVQSPVPVPDPGAGIGPLGTMPFGSAPKP
jgi:Cu/Ag efflux pump CusA